MATASVVECFNVGEHTCPHFVAGGIDAQIDQFAFQRTKEASHGRIVVQVPTPFMLIWKPQFLSSV